MRAPCRRSARPSGLSEEVINCGIWNGAYNIIAKISGYNGTDNDESVRIDFYASPGLEMDTGWECPLADFESVYPRWRVSSPWLVALDDLAEPFVAPGELPNSKYADAAAFVANGYFVARLPDGAPLNLAGDNFAFPGFNLRIQKGLWTGRIEKAQDGTWLVKDGLSVGRVLKPDLVNSFKEIGFCEDQGIFFDTLNTYVDENADVLADGSTDPTPGLRRHERRDRLRGRPAHPGHRRRAAAPAGLPHELVVCLRNSERARVRPPGGVRAGPRSRVAPDLDIPRFLMRPLRAGRKSPSYGGADPIFPRVLEGPARRFLEPAGPRACQSQTSTPAHATHGSSLPTRAGSGRPERRGPPTTERDDGTSAPRRTPSSEPSNASAPPMEDDPSPFRRAEPSDPDVDGAYVMIQSGPEVRPEDCEVEDVDAVEVTLFWGDTILHTAHMSPLRSFTLGDGATKDAPVDFVVPAEKLGASRVTLIDIVDGRPRLMLPPAAETSHEELSARGQLELSRGESCRLTLGDLAISVGVVAAGKGSRAGLLERLDRSAAGYFGLSALASAAIIGAMAAFTPALGLTADEGVERERLYAIQQYLDASAERDKEAIEEKTEAGEQQGANDPGSAGASKGAAGKMGSATAKPANRRAGWRGPADNPAPTVPREVALREAQTFGLIGILGSMNANDPNQVTAPWGADVSLGSDPYSALGNMWGDDLGESWGVNGLALQGPDEGGGGRANVIGIDGISTCAGELCRGRFSGLKDRPMGEHATRAPRIRPAGATQVSGRLPAETIQRVVRQSYGRFRSCYETGLRSNPNLEGRVTARFVIGRDGAVMNVANGGSDLPDSGVVSCVLGAYYGLSFPTPDNGVVRVSYPIMFSPAS